MKEEELIKGRLLDLANKSYNENIFTFTNFLGLLEQSVFYQIKKELGQTTTIFGGIKGCERVMVRFGDVEAFGYEVDFPIAVIKLVPKTEKYSDVLTHRDCLGALMNLGIERDVLGDIVFSEKEIFVFCKDTIGNFIAENLTRIKHTEVSAEVYTGNIEDIRQSFKEETIQIPSPRIDAVLAKTFKLSREKAGLFLKGGKVFVNGREITSSSAKVREKDIITLRGKGRMQYDEEMKSTKKGNLVVRILRFM